jgi:hypothetical protein
MKYQSTREEIENEESLAVTIIAMENFSLQRSALFVMLENEESLAATIIAIENFSLHRSALFVA